MLPRAALVVLLAGSAGAHSASGPSLREALPPGTGWWCARLPSGEGCFRTRAECDGIRARAGAPGTVGPSACASRAQAWCFAPRYVTTLTGAPPRYRLGSAVCAGDARGCARRRRESLAVRVPGGVTVDAATACEQVP